MIEDKRTYVVVKHALLMWLSDYTFIFWFHEIFALSIKSYMKLLYSNSQAVAILSYSWIVSSHHDNCSCSSIARLLCLHI